MIPTERAKAYLEAHRLPRVTDQALQSFSPPYRLVGEAVTQPLYGHRGKTPRELYHEAFGTTERGTNPWRSEEGARLAELVFGPGRGPYVAAAWEWYDRLPYQTGYGRRPFRTAYTEQYVGSKLQRFQEMYHDDLGGLELQEVLRYEGYSRQYNTDNSLIYAVALAGAEGEAVHSLMLDIVNGEDEIGTLTRSIVKGLLLSEDRRDWEVIGRLLLAAQQQEGLRQTILEALDETSLGALHYMIGVILEHDLSRFSSVVRAVGTWTGLGWDAPRALVVERSLQLMHDYFGAEDTQVQGLASDDHLERYLALWHIGLTDVDAANRSALAMLDDPRRTVRVLALFFVQQTARTNQQIVSWTEAHFGEDPEVDYRLMSVLPGELTFSAELFERVRTVADAVPTQGKVYRATVFEWLQTAVDAAAFYRPLITYASPEQLQLLGEDLARMPSDAREDYLRAIFPDRYTYRYGKDKEEQPLDLRSAPWKRGVILQAVTDRNQQVMLNGLALLRSIELQEEDLPVLVGLLARKGKSLRSGLISAILGAKPQWIEQLVPRLLDSKKVEQRVAGLEILSELHEGERQPGFVAAQIAAYRERDGFSKNESVFLDKFVLQREQVSYGNGFGVIDFDQLRPLRQAALKIKRAKRKGVLARLLGTENTDTYLLSHLVDREKILRELPKLLALIKQHAHHEYDGEIYTDHPVSLLVGQRIEPRIGMPQHTTGEILQALPLSEVWRQWYTDGGLSPFDLYAILNQYEKPSWRRHPEVYDTFLQRYYPLLPADCFGERDQYGNPLLPVRQLLTHLYDAYADHRMMGQFVVDLYEDQIARLPEQLRTTLAWKDHYGTQWQTHWSQVLRDQSPNTTGGSIGLRHEVVDAQTRLQLFDLQQLLRVSRQLATYPVPPIAYFAATEPSAEQNTVPDAGLVVHLHTEGQLSDDDLRLNALHGKQLLDTLEGLSYNDKPQYAAQRAAARRVLLPLKEALLDIELERGDLPTNVSMQIAQFKVMEGSDRLVHTLARLGRDTFHRGYSYYGDKSRQEVFSRLIKGSVPRETEELTDFLREVAPSKLPQKRWLEVAMYAPQWSPWIAELLGVPELESAVWWFHAHATSYMNKEKETIVARYTAIERDDLARGAIAIDWFYAVYGAVGKANWKLLHAASKYISDGNAHRQVKLYSGILLGEVKITETLARIKEKRDQLYVKGLGLVPLSKCNPAGDTLSRYELLQQFLNERKQFGSQRQESERQAVEIAIDNLARTAGYEDATRFSWIMEGESTRNLLEDAVVEMDDTRVELYIDELGKAQIAVEKKGKLLKDVPAKYRKDQRIVALKESKLALRKQLSRTRQSLEQAMVNGTVFTAAELAEIYRHPVVRVMLDQLVLSTAEGETTGFWRDEQIEGVDGELTAITSEERLRIAHPYDLYQRVCWDQYQKLAFDRKLRQPFKQIFRELYLVTADERETSRHSNRYQGHQIQPKKAVALLRGRGWTVSHEEGLQHVDHARGVIATMYAAADWYTPADVEAPTIEQVAFYDRRTYTYLPVDQIDPLLFSEVMRDIDLVVSVAHVGGVDPEASHSTLEMRAALARESARLFRLDNVEVKTRYVVIDGTLGQFQIHLGSGVVSKHGLQLHIQAVQSQHRGRVFLPFVDDDPKSAEIITKMRLIARDKELKDPTILAQLAK